MGALATIAPKKGPRMSVAKLMRRIMSTEKDVEGQCIEFPQLMELTRAERVQINSGVFISNPRIC